MVYLPYAQRLTPSLTAVARTSTDPERTPLGLPTAGRGGGSRPVGPRDENDGPPPYADAVAQLFAFVLSAFAIPAPALAAIGPYGWSATASPSGRAKIGVRMALGADGPRVVRLLVAGGVKLVIAGGALELTLAVIATRLLGGLLF